MPSRSEDNPSPNPHEIRGQEARFPVPITYTQQSSERDFSRSLLEHGALVHCGPVGNQLFRLHRFDQITWAGAQASSWIRILRQEDGKDKWLKFLGRSVIIRLEQIHTSSRTSRVQALVLLVAATSLSPGTEPEEEAAARGGAQQQQDQDSAAEKEEIRRARKFVLGRLGFLCMSNLSTPIQYVRNVVLKVFKRLDVGADIFWMDVLQSMDLVTVIG